MRAERVDSGRQLAPGRPAGLQDQTAVVRCAAVAETALSVCVWRPPVRSRHIR